MNGSVKILLLLAISMVYISIGRASYLSWLTRCCSKGRLKAQRTNDPTSCNSDDLSRRRFRNVVDRIICRHSERICCVKEMQKLSCQSGKYEASLGESCDTFRPFVGGDDFRECCDCCSLGIRARSDPYASCSTVKFPELMSKNFSLPCIQAFHECCRGNVTLPSVIPTIPTRQPKCSDNFCEQLCQDLPSGGAQCSCNNGYLLQADRVSCKDIDECQTNGSNDCGALERCVNTPGGYRCENQTEAACKLGEEKLDGSCIDIDECLRGLHRCGSQQTCVNNDGSYNCVCRRGYEASGRSCFDKDECVTKEAQCPQYSNCVNTDGSYRCECERGRQLQNNKCEDIDECSNGRYSCPQGTRCQNTDGSYKCTRVTCPPGQELGADGRCKPKELDICSRIQCGDGFVCDPNSPGRPCQDINECSLSPPKCKANEACYNYIGTFECRDPCRGVDCGSGLKCEPAGRSYSCLDIDECSILPRKCTGEQEICVNSYGSYSCRCRDQFQRNSQTRRCERVNPCSNEPCPRGYRCVVIDQTNYQCKKINDCVPKCRPDQKCVSYAGGQYYFCTCPEGYRLNRTINRCKDIDECRERRSGCSQECENTIGSYVCRCSKGYEMMPNGRYCRDINECDKGISGCSHFCENTLGSFACRCRRGYELNPDGRTCKDRNECDSVRCAYRCVNTAGSFRCICPSGYNSSNYYCSDFDECASGSAQCKNNAFCFNTYGFYRCIPKIICPADYKQVSDTRCDRSCKDGDLACFNRKVQRYSLWTFKLRSNDLPSRIFSYRIVTYGYKIRPKILFYFHRGNEDDDFEITTTNEVNGVIAFIRNKKRIKGPKNFLLEFRGDVIDSETNELASRYVHTMYVFVSRYDF